MSTRLCLSTLLVLGFVLKSSGDDAPPAIKQAREVNRLTADTVGELLKLALDEADWSFWREDAIRYLGELKAREAVEPLLRILLTKGMLRSETGSLSAYPAAQALAKIGSSIYPEVWGKLARDQSEKYLYVLAFTMIAIDGKSIVAFRVQEKLKTAQNDRLRQNLQRLLTILETPDIERPPNWPK